MQEDPMIHEYIETALRHAHYEIIKVSIYDTVTLEDDVFCGPSMVFTNVYNPLQLP